MDHNIGLILQKRAQLTPDLAALYDVDSGQRFTYAELDRRANQAANAFLSQDIKKGDRVGLLLKNGSEFIESLFALAKIGAITVPLNWRLSAEELVYILNDCGISSLLFDAEFSALIVQLQQQNNTQVTRWLQVKTPPEGALVGEDYSALVAGAAEAAPAITAFDDDDLFIMYTSGTTGSPKGVVHTHNTCMWATITNNATNPPRIGDRFLNILPLFHIGALNPMITCIKSAVCLVVPRSFDPRQTWQLIEEEHIATMLAVPAMLNAMLQAYHQGNIDHSQLRYCIVGAAPVPEHMIITYQNMGICLRQAYALTESCGSACILDEHETVNKIGSTGKPYFHTEVRVTDRYGNDAAVDETGQILIKGRHIMDRYWNNPEATAEAIQDGWLRTGDAGAFDQQGFLTIKDRIKDMIISGGENIYPAEVENVLARHPDIIEAAVIGRPHAGWGESPLAVVVCRPTEKTHSCLTENTVIDYCRAHLAAYKCPKNVIFIDVLPRNASGKILKRVLQEQYVKGISFENDPD